MKKFAYKWLPRIFGCRCKSNNSFFYNGQQFPVCARCTGKAIGILLSFLLFFFYIPSTFWASIMIIPMLTDELLTDELPRYKNTKSGMFIIGLFGGIGISVYVKIVLDYCVKFGDYLF